MQRPEKGEYAEYYEKYIALIPDGGVLQVLTDQCAELGGLFAGMPEERGLHRYAPGKWTMKESISHLIDAERIFAYRLLRISRGDTTPLPGFEQDGYIDNSNANQRTFGDLVDEFVMQRRANLRLIANLSPEASRRIGTASDNPVSARALVYMMAGHVQHHDKIFREQYLAA